MRKAKVQKGHVLWRIYNEVHESSPFGDIVIVFLIN